MAALFALPVLDDFVDPTDEGGTLVGAEPELEVAALFPTDTPPVGLIVASGVVVTLCTVDIGTGALVAVAKEVPVENERSELVALSVDCNEDELAGAVAIGLVGTLGRTLATIGATSPEAWFKTLAHIAAALVCHIRH